ncbi:hypothetical protein CAOG_001222 [Capsaspora owczarzaki ATCC 30864]|uniref:DNA-directed primase/polymerase protein n=1 Tax=Capsaspora owczarzaki (strain ATCC 30864) TaxID=595528 RepID=A0A0D2WJY3_CAPO3|nr:hypothetical protein CAOG_001222 [Capsaspora owczarzaki ATCC 30864]
MSFYRPKPTLTSASSSNAATQRETGPDMNSDSIVGHAAAIPAIHAEATLDAPTASTTERFDVPTKRLVQARRRELLWKQKLDHYRAVAARLARTHLPAENPFSASLFHVWRIFPKQDMAFAFAGSCFHKVHVFAFEAPNFTAGRRKFLVTSYAEFWHVYSQLLSDQRHYYEVIPDGCVCKAYFDVEFNASLNPTLDGCKAIDVLVRAIQYAFRKWFSITVARDQILDLDSTTQAKFSRHLIVNLPGAAFQSNEHVGKCLFVEWLAGQAECWRTDPSTMPAEVGIGADEVEVLFACTDKGTRTLMVDRGKRVAVEWWMCVYSRNRNFRIYLSSKQGKRVRLVASEQNSRIPKSSETGLPMRAFHHAVFLDSLICNVPFSQGVRILSWPGASAAPRRKAFTAATSSSTTSCSQGEASSPYPAVDAFILNAASAMGPPARLRRWIHFSESMCLLYDISGNRWCHNIDREHKSNGVYYVVDLSSRTWSQRCYDPDCRGFRSATSVLPNDVLQASGASEGRSRDGIAGGEIDEDDPYLLLTAEDASFLAALESLESDALPSSESALESICCETELCDSAEDLELDKVMNQVLDIVEMEARNRGSPVEHDGCNQGIKRRRRSQDGLDDDSKRECLEW